MLLHILISSNIVVSNQSLLAISFYLIIQIMLAGKFSGAIFLAQHNTGLVHYREKSHHQPTMLPPVIIVITRSGTSPSTLEI